ncbi:MAG: FixH family protein [Bacteroidia bacterium]|nr:FixH family protein [Bacteroidia bacterium]
MNWGWRIALLYLGFVAMIIALVAASSMQEFHLVTPDYYAEEVKYETRMGEIRNSQSLSEPVQIRMDLASRSLRVKFPDGLSGIQGEVKLYRPSDARLDRSWPAGPDETGLQQIDLSSLQSGRWRVKVAWSAGGAAYYDEALITLP